MLSFEYLIQLCQSKEWGPLPPEPRVSAGQWGGAPGQEQGRSGEKPAADGDSRPPRDSVSPLPTALPGLDQGRDACVHEIPFRFDLMGLLPQCQQLQMFFLLLSRGG